MSVLYFPTTTRPRDESSSSAPSVLSRTVDDATSTKIRIVAGGSRKAILRRYPSSPTTAIPLLCVGRTHTFLRTKRWDPRNVLERSSSAEGDGKGRFGQVCWEKEADHSGESANENYSARPFAHTACFRFRGAFICTRVFGMPSKHITPIFTQDLL
jgi:hypothetical protein